MRQKGNYDIFICYADNDLDWIKGFLLPALDSVNVNYHLEEAFNLGQPKLKEFEDAIQRSARILLVISSNYLADKASEFVNLLAQHHSLEKGGAVISLILESVTLPPRLEMLTKLNATNEQEQKEAIERLCQELEKPAPTQLEELDCPYPGMRAFKKNQSNLFFGRDRLIDKFIESLRHNNFVAAIGASGSGKSSLIFAGLIPELQNSSHFGKDEWLAYDMRPGSSPLKTLENVLKTDLAEPSKAVKQILNTSPKAERLLLVIDQFEELFSLDSQDALPFQKALLSLVKIPKCYVIIVIRADFYGYLAASPLWQIAEKYLLNVNPLDEEGLQEAITKPAKKVGVFVDKLLVRELVSEAKGEPGILPFVQETLVKLWRKMEQRYLSLAAYEKIQFTDDNNSSSNTELKGLKAAIAIHANEIFKKLNSPQKQAIAHRIFMRLVQFGEGRPDTRRQQSVDSLKIANEDTNVFEETLQCLVEHRLLTLSDEEKKDSRKVDIAHEALINGWPTLKEWVSKRRQAEQERRRLENKAAEWVRLEGRGGLLDAEELREAVKWQDSEDAEELGYSEDLKNLIEASQSAIQHAENQKKATTRKIIGGLIVALISVSGASVWAEYQRQEADYRGKINKSLQLATASEASLNDDATRSILLAIQANLIQETPQAAQALWKAFQQNHEQLQLEHDNTVTYAEFDPSNSNRVLTVSSDKTTKIWDFKASNKTPIVLKEHTQSVNYGSFNPTNTNQVLTVSNDGTARLWDISNVNKPIVISLIRDGTEPIRYGRINPNNPKQILTVSQRAAKLWDISNSQSPKVLKSLQGSEGEVWEGISDPKNFNRLLITSNNGTARIWDLSNSKQLIILKHQGVLNGSFDPNNVKQVLTVGTDNMARIWNLDSPSPSSIVLKGHNQHVNYGSFHPTKSNQVLTVSDDGTARIWDIKTGQELKSFIVGQNKILYHTFNPSDSNQFLTVSSDGKAKIWDIEKSTVLYTLYGHTASIRFASFDLKNPKRILTASEDKTARIWDITDKAYIEISNRNNRKSSSIISGIFDPYSQDKALTIARDGTISSWDINSSKEDKIQPMKIDSLEYAQIDPNNPSRVVTVNSNGIAKLITGKSIIPLIANGRVESVTFDSKNPNRILTVSSTVSTATIWDVSSNSAKKLQELRVPRSSPMNQGEFDPNNPNRVATVGGDGIVRIWNLQQTNQPEKKLSISKDRLWHVSFDPKDSNRILVMGSDKVARIWDIANNKLITELNGHQDVLSYGSFDSKNSNRVLTISNDGTARIWDLRNPTNSLILRGDNQKLFYGSFDSNNSNRVITVNSEGIARIYQVGGKDLLSLSWDNTSRCFNSKEEIDYNLLNKDLLKALSVYIHQEIEQVLVSKRRLYCQ